MHMSIMNNCVSLLLQLSSILILSYVLPAIHLSRFQIGRSSGQRPFFFCWHSKAPLWLCVKQGSILNLRKQMFMRLIISEHECKWSGMRV